jgi:hypothetical protein
MSQWLEKYHYASDSLKDPALSQRRFASLIKFIAAFLLSLGSELSALMIFVNGCGCQVYHFNYNNYRRVMSLKSVAPFQSARNWPHFLESALIIFFSAVAYTQKGLIDTHFLHWPLHHMEQV